MTIEEKKAILNKYCQSHTSCDLGCVFNDPERGFACIGGYDWDDGDENVERAYALLLDRSNEDAMQASLNQLSENAKIACEGILEGVKNTSVSEDIEKLRDTFEAAKADILVRHQDMVNHPGHYESGKFECIDVMLETQGPDAVAGFCICNAFKYLYRHNRKNGIEDVKKARWYINKYLEILEGKNND